MSKFDFNYVVIGSGPAGSSAALALAKAKKTVALVEGRYFGGANLNTRDVPYAVALNFSHTFSKLSSSPEFQNQDFSFSFPTLITHQLKTVIESGGNNKSIYEKAGVICFPGYANFLDDHTIAIGDRKITAKNFILATGSTLKTLEISGTENVNYLTPETAIRTKRLPKAIAVVGAGSTGCEIAEYFAELGAKVVLLETSSRILPREDKEASQALHEYFVNQLGIMVLPKCKVVALEQDDVSKRVIFRNAQAEKMVRVDCIVLATGSQPVLDYGLENAGVKHNNNGIIVNKYFETSAKHIYAVGDCLGQESSTERANYEGSILASNLINKSKSVINYRGFSRITNTYPEIATIGLNEDDLTRRDHKYKKSLVPLTETTMSKVDHLNYGFVKILADKKNDRILGATIVAPHASLMANEISLAIRHNLTALELASAPHIANSYSHAIKLAAKKLISKK